MSRKKRDEKTVDLFAYAHDNRPSIVYTATNTTNGHRYIGITRLTLDQRRKAHFKEAKFGRQKHSSYFYNAIRFFGEEAFSFEVVKNCGSYKEAGLEEIRLIAETKPEYNLSPGGDGLIGYRPSAETRRRQSESHKGQVGNWLGKKRPDIVEGARARLLANPLRPMLGRKHTEKSRKKMSDTHKARGMTQRQIDGNARRRKPVICLTDGRVFMGGRREAAVFYGVSHERISYVLRGGRPNACNGLMFAHYPIGMNDDINGNDGLQPSGVGSIAGSIRSDRNSPNGDHHTAPVGCVSGRQPSPSGDEQQTAECVEG